MIGKLRGVIDSYGEDWVILDVGGVGYVVFCSTRTLAALPPAGEAATLAIETYVREDQIRLFGFTTDLEREWFRLLQTVQGIGTRVALAILSTLKASDLATAIALGDKAAISRAPGVGPEGRAAGRHGAEGQGAGLHRHRARCRQAPGRPRRQACAGAGRPTLSPLSSISATARRRPPPRWPRRCARRVARPRRPSSSASA